MHNRRFAVKPHCGLRMWGIAKAPSREAFELLTMHGVEKPIVLDVQFLGRGKDPWGNERAGFHAATTINRKERYDRGQRRRIGGEVGRTR